MPHLPCLAWISWAGESGESFAGKGFGHMAPEAGVSDFTNAVGMRTRKAEASAFLSSPVLDTLTQDDC